MSHLSLKALYQNKAILIALIILFILGFLLGVYVRHNKVKRIINLSCNSLCDSKKIK